MSSRWTLSCPAGRHALVSYVESLNIGVARPIAAKSGVSGIDKRPVSGPVLVRAPGANGSGLNGDTICDTDNHGGDDQAVYAYARGTWTAGRAIWAGRCLRARSGRTSLPAASMSPAR